MKNNPRLDLSDIVVGRKGGDFRRRSTTGGGPSIASPSCCNGCCCCCCFQLFAGMAVGAFGAPLAVASAAAWKGGKTSWRNLLLLGAFGLVVGPCLGLPMMGLWIEMIEHVFDTIPHAVVRFVLPALISLVVGVAVARWDKRRLGIVARKPAVLSALAIFSLGFGLWVLLASIYWGSEVNTAANILLVIGVGLGLVSGWLVQARDERALGYSGAMSVRLMVSLCAGIAVPVLGFAVVLLWGQAPSWIAAALTGGTLLLGATAAWVDARECRRTHGSVLIVSMIFAVICWLGLTGISVYYVAGVADVGSSGQVMLISIALAVIGACIAWCLRRPDARGRWLLHVLPLHLSPLPSFVLFGGAVLLVASL